MCIEKESPQHQLQRQGNNCHIDADAIFTPTCCLRKASALVQMHPPIPPLPSLNVSRQRIHRSRNAAALVGPVSMSINATLTMLCIGAFGVLLLSRYATKYQVTYYENRRLPTNMYYAVWTGRFVSTRGVETT